MKASYKMLLIISGVITALFITGLMVLRKDLDSLPKSNLEFEEVILGSFNKVAVSDYWNVKVTQGRVCSVKLFYDETSKVTKPKLYISDSTLMISIDSTDLDYNYFNRISIEIIAPKIRSFDVGDSSRLHLKGLNMDSISIHLGDASTFISEENTFKHLLFESLGSSSIEYIADPYE